MAPYTGGMMAPPRGATPSISSPTYMGGSTGGMTAPSLPSPPTMGSAPGSPFLPGVGGVGNVAGIPLLGSINAPAEINTGGSYGVNTSATQSFGGGFNQSFIPDYAESPILRSIALQAQSLAPQALQWGMDQFNRTQGNIDMMMRNALSYASPERIKSEMGRAEASVMQAGEKGRQAAVQDLQSYGINPSAGRYAALDAANRVATGAAAAGAGNVQREATIGQGTQMQQAALGAGMENVKTGYGAFGAANELLGTAMRLPYPTLGTAGGQYQQSLSQALGQNISLPPGPGVTASPRRWSSAGGGGGGGPAFMQEGGGVDDDESPSNGARVDDVPANLTAGELVIPRDVSEWKGQEFFYKLMAQARAARAQLGSEPQSNGNGRPMLTGYGAQ